MPDLTKRASNEQALTAAVIILFGSQRERLMSALRDHQPVSWADIQSETEDSLAQHLRDSYSASAVGMLDDNGTPLTLGELPEGTEDRIDSYAEEYAATRASELSRLLSQTTQDRFEELQDRFADGEIDEDDLAGELEDIFSESRADAIAISETTEAGTSAEIDLAGMAGEAGIELEPVWNTAEDEDVCSVCAPMDGVPLSDAPADLSSGPPAHPSCRCYLTFERLGLP